MDEFIGLEKISYCEELGIDLKDLPKGNYNYVYFYVDNGKHVISESLQKLFTPLKTIIDVEDFLIEYFLKFNRNAD